MRRLLAFMMLSLPIFLGSCAVKITRTYPPHDSDGKLVVPRQLQIAITSEAQRPYAIRQIDRKYTQQELLKFLERHFRDLQATERDAILINPEVKVSGDRLAGPIVSFAKKRGIRVVLIEAPVGAIDSLFPDGHDIGVPITGRPR